MPQPALLHDGDGNRVKTTINGTTTVYVGNYYEKTGSVVKKHYYAGGARVALRDNGTLRFLLSDHLNGTNVTTTDAGAFYASLRYHPWGTVRYANGSTPTKYQFTGQYSFAGEFGLLDFKARYYDPQLGRFAAPDTVIPQGQGTQAWDRYAYANNSPTNFTDPSGHAIACGEGPDTGACGDETAEYRYWRERQYNLACQNGTGDGCSEMILLGKNQAVGVRIESTAWAIAGVDLNVDILYFEQSSELGIFFTPGAQKGLGQGGGATLGLLFSENVPNRSAYAGPSVTMTGADLPVLPLGITIEGDQTMGAPNADGSIPTTTYIGVGPLTGETGIYTGSGLAFNSIDFLSNIFSLIGDLFKRD